jgi:NTE family protein
LSPLSRILREHLAGSDEESIAFVEAGAHYLTLRPGEVLLRQGDSGDDVYFVLSGRMRAETIGEAGTVLGEIGRGESVGELAMFTGELRSATITALRQTTLARIPRELIDRAIALRPELALQLTRRVVARFRSRDEIRPAPIVPVRLCIVPITLGVDARGFAHALAGGQPGRVPILDAASVGSRVGEALSGLIDALEGDHAAIYLVADPGDSAWARACLQNADEILLLADAEVDPRLSVIEMQLLAGPGAVTVARRSLICCTMPKPRRLAALHAGWRCGGR